MLVQPQLAQVEEGQRSAPSYLTSKIMEIIDLYSRREKANDIYLQAQLDSIVGFKIQLKFTKIHLFVRGTLLYSNGQPIPIPEAYCDMILRKLQQSLQTSIRFYYSREIASILFQSSIKLAEDVQDLVPTISQHISTIVNKLPQIYQQLVNFGIVKKFNIGYSKYILKKLKLMSHLTNTLKLQQTEKQTIFSSNSQEANQKKGSVFKYYNSIQQVEYRSQSFEKKNKLFANVQKNQPLKRGGYFQVQKKMCKVIQSKSQKSQHCPTILQMAVKKLRKQQENVIHCQNKILKEFRILHEIQNPSHSLTYWVKQKNGEISSQMEDKIYMTYVQETLDDRIYGRQNSIKDIINYSQQLINAVNILHTSGIVHRDLKPDNLLLRTNKSGVNQKSRQIIVIDFGESSLKKDAYSKKPQDILGSTLPYSPIQCFVSCEEGYNSPQIDLWSVGVILYQIINKKNPLTYSKCFSADIYRGWRSSDQFSIFPNLKKKKGIRVIENVFNFLSMHSICIEQKQRICLKKMEVIVNSVEHFLTEVEQL